MTWSSKTAPQVGDMNTAHILSAERRCNMDRTTMQYIKNRLVVRRLFVCL